MTYSLGLLRHRLVALRVLVGAMTITVSISVASASKVLPSRIDSASLVEEILGLLQVFAVACNDVELGQSHLCNLMSGHDIRLSRVGTNLSAYAVGKANGNVQEGALARSIVVSHCRFTEMAEIIKLVGAVLHSYPTLASRPAHWLFGVLRAGSIEVAVGFLCRGNDAYHSVAILVDGLAVDEGIGVRLHQVGGAFQSLVGVGVVEREPHRYLEGLGRVFDVLGSLQEVVVAMLRLAFAERKRNRDIATGLKALPPKRTWGDLYGSEGNGCDRVARLVSLGVAAPHNQRCKEAKQDGLFHYLHALKFVILLRKSPVS